MQFWLWLDVGQANGDAMYCVIVLLGALMLRICCFHECLSNNQQFTFVMQFVENLMFYNILAYDLSHIKEFRRKYDYPI